jgi:hypothetical protein
MTGHQYLSYYLLFSCRGDGWAIFVKFCENCPAARSPTEGFIRGGGASFFAYSAVTIETLLSSGFCYYTQRMFIFTKRSFYNGILLFARAISTVFNLTITFFLLKGR